MENHFDSKTSNLTPNVLAFLSATTKALRLISQPLTSASGIAKAKEMPMQPLPVPKSKTFDFFFIKERAALTRHSVSGRGSKTCLLTKNSDSQKCRLPIICEIGSYFNLLFISR